MLKSVALALLLAASGGTLTSAARTADGFFFDSHSTSIGFRQDANGKSPTQDANPSQDPAQSAGKAQTEQNIQATIERLVTAMDQLIPGEFPSDSPLPVRLREAAQSLLERKTEQATKQLDDLIKEHPTLPPSQLLLGGMYFSLNEGELGRLALEQAAIDRPDHPGVYTALARMAINQGWWASSAALLAQLRQAIDAGNWPDEQKQYFDSEYLDAMADTAIGQRRFDVARDYLTQLRSKLPKNASILFRMAEVDYRQSQFDSALENLARSRELDAKVHPPELVLYQWSTRRNQAEDTQRWIEAAAEKFPDELPVQLEYSRYLMAKGDLALASEWVDHAEKSSASLPIVRFLRGQIAFIRRAYDVAEAEFRELRIQSPNDAAIRNMLALCLAESEEATKQQAALEFATTNFRASPNNPSAAATLAWTLYRLGNTQQATQILTQLSSQPNVSSETAYYVARVLMDQRHDERAAKLLRDSLAAPGLFLYRNRAEEELAEVEQRLAAGQDSGVSPAPESNDDKR